MSCLLLSACAGSRQASFSLHSGSPGIELEEVVFFGQRDFQCGPAALAMVLHHSGEKVQPDDLTPLLFVPGRRGSLQLEMIAAARRSGRIPYPIKPEAAAIAAELAAGRPVLVLQNLGMTWLPAYHYAVVVGLLPGDRVVLRSGEQPRLVMDGRRFLATWGRADNWGMVLLRPGELPAVDEPIGYLQAVAAFETTGQHQIARRGYEAALARWPRQPVALFGLGNCLLAAGDEDQAAMVYRRLLAIEPEHAAAVNNLAEALSRRGCRRQALVLLDRTLASSDGGGSFRPTLQQTRDEIAARLQQEGDDGGCPPTPDSP
nr:PA2778 family cysteine peptidase [Desulfoprunum benzoelyticum]